MTDRLQELWCEHKEARTGTNRETFSSAFAFVAECRAEYGEGVSFEWLLEGDGPVCVVAGLRMFK